MQNAYLLLGVSLLAMASGCESAPDTALAEARSALTGESPVRFRARFLLDGHATPASLVVANADARHVFRDVREVDALVPRVATYTLTLKDPRTGKPTFRDVIPTLTLPPEGMDVDIHLVEGAQANHFEPMLIIEERGANAIVHSSTTPPRAPGQPFRLDTTVQGTPGKQVILDTILEPPRPERAYSCPAPCPLIYPEPSALNVDCSVYCFTCSSTAVLKGGFWIANYNMCSLTLDTGGQAQRGGMLVPLPLGQGGVALVAALRDDAAVPLEFAVLQSRGGARSELRPPFAKRSYPDFLVPEGSYTYEARVADASSESGYATFALPMPVADGAIRAFLLNLPHLGDLTPFRARALGDSRLGLALRSARSTFARGELLVDVDHEPLDDAIGWALVSLPEDAIVESVSVGPARGDEPLIRDVDYTLRRAKGMQLLTLLVQRGRDAFAIRIGATARSPAGG